MSQASLIIEFVTKCPSDLKKTPFSIRRLYDQKECFNDKRRRIIISMSASDFMEITALAATRRHLTFLCRVVRMLTSYFKNYALIKSGLNGRLLAGRSIQTH